MGETPGKNPGEFKVTGEPAAIVEPEAKETSEQKLLNHIIADVALLDKEKIDRSPKMTLSYSDFSKTIKNIEAAVERYNEMIKWPTSARQGFLSFDTTLQVAVVTYNWHLKAVTLLQSSETRECLLFMDNELRSMMAAENVEFSSQPAKEISPAVAEPAPAAPAPAEKQSARTEQPPSLANRLETFKKHLALEPKTQKYLEECNKSWFFTRFIRRFADKPEKLYDIPEIERVVEIVGIAYLKNFYETLRIKNGKQVEDSALEAGVVGFGFRVNKAICENAKINKSSSPDNSLRANDFREPKNTAQNIGKLAEMVGRGEWQAAISLVDALHDNGEYDKFLEEGAYRLPIKMEPDQLDVLNQIIMPHHFTKQHTTNFKYLDDLLNERSISYNRKRTEYLQQPNAEGIVTWDDEEQRYMPPQKY